MKKTIWDSMLDAEMNQRYWQSLSNRYYTREQRTKIFLAVMASGTVASWGFWSQYELVWKILSSVSALVAIALPILNWPKMIENMGYLTEKWTRIRNDYELLWIDAKVDTTDVNKIKKELKRIKNEESSLSQKEINLPNDSKLLLVCYEKVLSSRGL